MTPEEIIYERFVNYETNHIPEMLKKSILKAIVASYEKGYRDGFVFSSGEADKEIKKNYQPNER